MNTIYYTLTLNGSSMPMWVGGLFLFTVRCPNGRHKRIKGEYKADARCNSIICLLDLADKEIIVRCGSCNTFWKITIKDGSGKISLTDKADINFGEPLALKIGSYQVRNVC